MVKCVMLVSGQPMFYLDEGDGKMTEPALVFLYQDEQKQQNVTFQHMLAFSDEGKCDKLEKSTYLVEYEVSKSQMRDHYTNYTVAQRERRSGIINPNSQQGASILQMAKGGAE